MGFYPVTAGVEVYDQAYFDRFGRQADTELGRAIMDARVDMVTRHWDGDLVDVGIGSGAFLQHCQRSAKPNRRGLQTCGYDVCPAGRRWLQERNLWLNPYVEMVDAASLWDVLEHLRDFEPLLGNVRQWLFLSIPIFKNRGHVLGSKHFRRDEHYWYFTLEGLVATMFQLGFECADANDMETQLGREDIGSFAFHRR